MNRGSSVCTTSPSTTSIAHISAAFACFHWGLWHMPFIGLWSLTSASTFPLFRLLLVPLRDPLHFGVCLHNLWRQHLCNLQGVAIALEEWGLHQDEGSCSFYVCWLYFFLSPGVVSVFRISSYRFRLLKHYTSFRWLASRSWPHAKHMLKSNRVSSFLVSMQILWCMPCSPPPLHWRFSPSVINAKPLRCACICLQQVTVLFRVCEFVLFVYSSV